MSDLQPWAERQGYPWAAAPAAELLPATARHWQAWGKAVHEDPFYRRFRSRCIHLDQPVPVGASVLVVAVPVVAQRVRLQLADRELQLILPPIYLGFAQRMQGLLQELKAVLGETEVEFLRGPFKLVAAQLEPFAYGRNGILYHAELGSYMHLAAFLVRSGLDPSHASGTVNTLARCADCRACVEACPTGALPPDGGLLDAPRCLSFHVPLASRTDQHLWREQHTCWLGCLACQEACPLNRGKLVYASLELPFSQQQLEELIRDPAALDHSVDTFRELGMGPYADVLGPNLQFLVNR